MDVTLKIRYWVKIYEMISYFPFESKAGLVCCSLSFFMALFLVHIICNFQLKHSAHSNKQNIIFPKQKSSRFSCWIGEIKSLNYWKDYLVGANEPIQLRPGSPDLTQKVMFVVGHVKTEFHRNVWDSK